MRAHILSPLVKLFALAAIIGLASSTTFAAVDGKAKKSVQRQPKKNIRILTFQDKKKAQELRAQAIRSIKQLLDETKDDGKRYELMRRYGEQFAEQAEYALEKEMILYDQAYKKWEIAKKGDAPKLDNKMSGQSLKKAVEIYRQIVAKYSNYPGIDVTYYELGKNLIRLEDKSGVTYLLKLVKEQRQSPYIPEALFALGEFYFDEHDMVEARKYYNEAAKHRAHTIYPYAVYKLGWTYYNFPADTPEEEQAKFKKAITAFKLVVKLASNLKDEQDRVIYLREEAINDLIMVWAETEDVDAAWAYFKSIGDQNAFYRMLEKLGDIYIDQGAREKAIAVFTRIFKEVPTRESNPDSHAKLVKIFAESSKFNDVVEQASLMTKLYLKGGRWAEANKAKPELLADATAKVESTIHFHATSFHKDAQKRKFPDLYATSAKLYVIYLKNFPTNPKAYELRYFLGDVLFELKHFDDAATQYTLVAKANEKDGKYLEEAAMNAVISMNEVVSAAKFPDPEKPGSLKSPVAIPKEKLKLQSVLDYYAKLFPKKPDSKAMLVTAAKVSFDYGHYPDAIDRFTTIGLAYGSTKQSEESIKTVLGYYKERKDWDNTIKYCYIFLKPKGVLSGELLTNTQKLLVFASFERALAFEKAGKPLDAAAAFIQYQKDFPKEDNAGTALYNSMVIYFKLGLVENALESAKAVLKNYPKFDRKADVITTVAETYEGLGDFNNASQFFAIFAKQYPKDPRAADNLYTAGILAKGASKDPEAATYLQDFITLYPGHKMEIAATLEIAEAQERLKNNAGAIQAYQTIANRFAAKANEATLARAKLIRLSATKDQPFGDLKALGALHKFLTARGAPDAPEARKLIGESLFNLAEPAFRTFIAGKIDNSNLEKALQAKQGQLEKLAQNYQAIIALQNGEYTVASTYRLAQANEAFALAINGTKAPDALDAKTKAEVNQTLTQIASNLRQESYNFYTSAFNATIKQRVFTDWGVKSYERMSQIDPKKSPAIGEFTVAPGYTAHSLEYDNSIATALH